MSINLLNDSTPSPESSWKGYTLDELKMARAKSLMRREMGRLEMRNKLASVGNRAKTQGVRGLLFNNKEVARLNTMDYLYLAFKGLRIALKMYANRRRR